MTNVLTDEEINQFWFTLGGDFVSFARDIERAVLAKAGEQEAEPIVEVGQHGLSNVFYMIELNQKSLYKGQKLYAKPPPSQSVPEKIKPSTRTLESIGYANGWNDCIDAMLSAPPKV